MSTPTILGIGNAIVDVFADRGDDLDVPSFLR